MDKCQTCGRPVIECTQGADACERYALGLLPRGKSDRTANPFSYYAVRKPKPLTERLPEPPVRVNWREPEPRPANPGFCCALCGQGFDFPCRCD